MSDPNPVKGEEVFQLGDFFQELIHYNLQKKKQPSKADIDDQLIKEDVEGLEGRPGRPEAARKQKKSTPFAPRMINPDNIAFGPSGDGLQTREMEKGFEFSGKTTNFLVDGDSSYLKPTEYAFIKQTERLEIANETENDETILFFQISEENLLAFLGSEGIAMEVEDDERAVEFDNFGNPLYKHDTKNLLRTLQDKQLELNTDFKEFAEISLDGKILKLESFTPPKDQDMQLVKHDPERSSVSFEGTINNFFVAL